MFLCVLFVGFALAFLFLFELLLVGVNTVLQTAQFLCKRVRQVDLVERIRRRRTDTLTGNLDDARLDADNRGIRRNLLQYDSIRADTAVVTHLERSENLRAGRNEHVVADGRVTLAGVVTGTAERYTVVNRAVVANLSGFTDNDAHAVVNKQAFADLGTRVDLNTGHMPRKLRQRTRKKEMLVFVQPVRLTVVKQGVKALIEQNNFQCGACCRVAVPDRACIFKQSLKNHSIPSKL